MNRAVLPGAGIGMPDSSGVGGLHTAMSVRNLVLRIISGLSIDTQVKAVVRDFLRVLIHSGPKALFWPRWQRSCRDSKLKMARAHSPETSRAPALCESLLSLPALQQSPGLRVSAIIYLAAALPVTSATEMQPSRRPPLPSPAFFQQFLNYELH